MTALQREGPFPVLSRSNPLVGQGGRQPDSPPQRDTCAACAEELLPLFFPQRVLFGTAQGSMQNAERTHRMDQTPMTGTLWGYHGSVPDHCEKKQAFWFPSACFLFSR